MAFNHDKSFNFEQKTNPAYPLQVQNPDVKGDFSDIRNTIISMQIGMGYDIPLNATDRKTPYKLECNQIINSIIKDVKTNRFEFC